MAVTADLVRHIAKLARLKLTDAEVARFTPQLAAIIGDFEHLSEVPTDGVVETNQVTGLTNVSRPDIVAEFPYQKELIACSRNPIEDGQIKVKKSI